MFCAERAADRAVVRQGASNQRASIMKVVPLAIATALAATLGSVPASFAQPYGQNNQGNNQSEYQSDTMGAGNQAQNDDDWRRGRAEDGDVPLAPSLKWTTGGAVRCFKAHTSISCAAMLASISNVRRKTTCRAACRRRVSCSTRSAYWRNRAAALT